jgi:hypothetical protein
MRVGFHLMELSMRTVLHGVFSLLLLASCADGLVEEQVDVGDGVVTTCGEGDGLTPCLDPNGETVSEEENPDYIGTDSTKQLEQSSAEIRNETPKELEKTVQEMEDAN